MEQDGVSATMPMADKDRNLIVMVKKPLIAIRYPLSDGRVSDVVD